MTVIHISTQKSVRSLFSFNKDQCKTAVNWRLFVVTHAKCSTPGIDLHSLRTLLTPVKRAVLVSSTLTVIVMFQNQIQNKPALGCTDLEWCVSLNISSRLATSKIRLGQCTTQYIQYICMSSMYLVDIIYLCSLTYSHLNVSYSHSLSCNNNKSNDNLKSHNTAN